MKKGDWGKEKKRFKEGERKRNGDGRGIRKRGGEREGKRKREKARRRERESMRERETLRKKSPSSSFVMNSLEMQEQRKATSDSKVAVEKAKTLRFQM